MSRKTKRRRAKRRKLQEEKDNIGKAIEVTQIERLPVVNGSPKYYNYGDYDDYY